MSIQMKSQSESYLQRRIHFRSEAPLNRYSRERLIPTRDDLRHSLGHPSCALLRFRIVLLQRTANADFFYFLSHIHGPWGASTNALAQHMMLYHPQVNPDCLPSAVHKSGSSLSVEAVLANCRMRQGFHAALIGCGSGIPQHPAVDEPLGLVAFLCSGASSMVSASWDILADDACWWTRSYQEAWAREERRVRESGIQGPVGLLTCFRDAVRRLITR